MYDEINVTVEIIANACWLVGYVKDNTGVPLEGALVSVPDISTTTIASGSYNMTLSAGTYNVTASKEGHESKTVKDVVIATGEEKTVNITLNCTSGTLRGSVRDADTGEVLSGVVVTVGMAGVNKTSVSNVSGGYQMVLVPAGTCNLKAEKSGYATNTTTVEIVAGQEKVLDIELTKVVEKKKGLSTAILAGIAVAIIAAVLIAVYVLMRGKKGAEPSPAPSEEPKT